MAPHWRVRLTDRSQHKSKFIFAVMADEVMDRTTLES